MMTDVQLVGVGRVIWITGMSGAGKSILATELTHRMRVQGDSVVLLDGDELREVFGASTFDTTSYGREGRLAFAQRYAQLCKLIADQGPTVVIATISLFKEIHAWNRVNLPGYFEVYLKVPLVELRRRDPKGIYTRFDSGELSNVAGLDLSIDEPQFADLVVEFDPVREADTVVSELMKFLKKGNE